MSKETETGCGAVGAPVAPSVRLLVERLRAGENFYAESSPWFDGKLAEAVDEAADRLEQLADEYEIRPDGSRVRKDRWEWAVRRIVALLWGNRQEFECDEVVEAVRALVPCPHVEGDDEALAHATQKRFAA